MFIEHSITPFDVCGCGLRALGFSGRPPLSYSHQRPLPVEKHLVEIYFLYCNLLNWFPVFGFDLCGLAVSCWLPSAAFQLCLTERQRECSRTMDATCISPILSGRDVFDACLGFDVSKFGCTKLLLRSQRPGRSVCASIPPSTCLLYTSPSPRDA